MIGLELLPDWTPARNPRLGRFDVVVKAAEGSFVASGTGLSIRLLGGPDGPQQVRLGDELPSLIGPAWREIRGQLIDLHPSVYAAEAVLGERVSARMSRREAMTPVVLRAFRDTIQTADEPLAWWRYVNETDEPVDVRSLRSTAVISVDDRHLGMSGRYNGLAALPPGRAMRGLLSADDLDLRSPGTYRVRLELNGNTSDVITITRAEPGNAT
jgi:hypothetical protein